MRRIIPSGSLFWKRFRLLGLVTLVFCCLYGYIVSFQFPTGQETHPNVKFFAPDQSALLFKTQAKNSDTRLTATSQTSVAAAATSTAVAQTSTVATQTSMAIAQTVTAIAAIPPASGGTTPMGGNSSGWRQIFAEDFNRNVSVGEFLDSLYSNQFTVYSDGTADTAGQNGGHSRYFPSKVVSVHDGSLDLHLRSENGTPMGAALLPILPGNHLYGKYSIRFRSDAIAGFKFVSLLWPDSGVWPRDGEFDFPEGNLTEKFFAFVHHQAGKASDDQDSFVSGVDFSAWHTTSIEWTPGKVRFLLDGAVIGESTTRIPNTPMHWVMQAEACLSNCPSTYSSGHFQIDWVTAHAMA